MKKWIYFPCIWSPVNILRDQHWEWIQTLNIFFPFLIWLSNFTLSIPIKYLLICERSFFGYSKGANQSNGCKSEELLVSLPFEPASANPGSLSWLLRLLGQRLNQYSYIYCKINNGKVPHESWLNILVLTVW